MKNGSLVLNVILLIAVAVLYVLHFTSGGSARKVTEQTKGGDTASFVRNDNIGASRIAYFEMDSIESGFEMVKDVKDSIAKRDEENQKRADDLDRQYERRYNELGATARTPDQIAAARNELSQLKDMHNRQKQEMIDSRGELQLSLSRSVQSTIEEYLKTYNKDNRYNFIFSYEPGLIYYRDTLFNITPEIIKGLNEMYRKKKSQTKKPD